MIVKGLAANDRHQLAREIVCDHLNNMAAVFKETGTVTVSKKIEPGKQKFAI